jgi:hypothetical protein
MTAGRKYTVGRRPVQSGSGSVAARAIHQKIVHLSAMGNLMLVCKQLHSFLII